MNYNVMFWFIYITSLNSETKYITKFYNIWDKDINWVVTSSQKYTQNPLTDGRLCKEYDRKQKV